MNHNHFCKVTADVYVNSTWTEDYCSLKDIADVTTYRLQRRGNCDIWSTVQNSATTSFTDSAVVNGAFCSYRARVDFTAN